MTLRIDVAGTVGDDRQILGTPTLTDPGPNTMVKMENSIISASFIGEEGCADA